MEKFFKEYFDTPKMPLSFYYTIITPPSILILLLIITQQNNIIFSIIALVFFVIVQYTTGWFVDYILSTSKNQVIRYFATRSLVFRRDFSSIVADIYRRNSQSKAYTLDWEKNQIYENHSVYVKRTFLGILMNIIFRFFVGGWLISLSWITMVIHKNTIKKYKNFINKQGGFL
ncbi:hypothetical protein MXZ32_09790 [Streptococcus uberis]|nr:hypothetical protein [Streptococcus uberis]MCK1197322.1 hypothetical protein [Streptococcus uberis]